MRSAEPAHTARPRHETGQWRVIGAIKPYSELPPGSSEGDNSDEDSGPNCSPPALNASAAATSTAADAASPYPSHPHPHVRLLSAAQTWPSFVPRKRKAVVLWRLPMLRLRRLPVPLLLLPRSQLSHALSGVFGFLSLWVGRVRECKTVT